VIGDRSRVHLPLPSPLVSRAHALIVLDGDDVFARDLASRNKLFVNGAAVREIALRQGNLLEIGPYRFRCWAGFNGPVIRAEEPPPRAHVTLVRSGRSHPLEGRSFLIGRRAECDLPLALQTVSRVHAVIFQRGGRHFVRDLNSRAGTLVNGQPIREVELNEGDELQIAAFTLRYQADAAPANGDGEAFGGSEVWAASSSALSGSASLGSQTSLSTTQVSIPAAEGPPATADELGVSGTGISTALSSEADQDAITPAELFPPETGLLPAASEVPQPDDSSSPRPQNGNGSH
jgi:pSer/pThr/pTyr-binding forkhead associated (FHA) protein